MGVRGIRDFIKSSNILQPHHLRNTKVVIDGSNFIHYLYEMKKIDYVHGGEYNKYAVEVNKCFTIFEECDIKPIIVFDGTYGDSDIRFRKRCKRFEIRLERVKKASENKYVKDSITPINLFEVFKSILSERNIPFVQCENESDAQVAALANYYECPVLSNDQDFCIYDIKKGFIELYSIDYTVKSIVDENGLTLKGLNCKIYEIGEFFIAHPGINKETLPLLATLAGNDFYEYHVLQPFYEAEGIDEEQLVEGVKELIDNLGINEAMNRVLKNIDSNKKADMKFLMEKSIDSYKLGTSDLGYIVDETEDYEEKILSKSKLATPCGAKLPNKFITAFSAGKARGDFMNIINMHRMILYPQVEDFSSASSYDCSRYVRRILYGILLGHEPSNKKEHNKICEREIEEYSQCGGKKEVVKAAPIFSLPSGKSLPKLNEIYNLSKEVKRNLLINIMDIKESVSLLNCPELSLYLISIIHWLKNCYPKPFREFLQGLILSIIYFYVLKKPAIESTAGSSYDKEAHMFFCIPEIEKELANEKIEKFSTNDKDNSLNVKIAHSYAQFQTCLLYISSLNELLDFPFECPKLYNMLDGTLLHNLTKYLIKQPKPEISVANLLGNTTTLFNSFQMLHKEILSQLPSGFDWQKNVLTYEWNRSKYKVPLKSSYKR